MKNYCFVPTIFDLDSDWFDLDPIGDNQYIDADSLKMALDSLYTRLVRQNPTHTVTRIHNGVTSVNPRLFNDTRTHRYLYTFSLRRDG